MQLINKVAGLYGLITIFVGGSFTQLTFYAYSTASLFAFLWALKTVKSVRNSKRAQLTDRKQPTPQQPSRTFTR